MSNAITAKAIQDINPADVRSVYVGKGACCCGCMGKHSYADAYTEEAGTDRGYAVTQDEVDDRVVARTLRLVQSEEALGVVDVDGGSVISTEVGGLTMIVYLRDGVLAKAVA
jgi:hypothetical protein